MSELVALLLVVGTLALILSTWILVTAFSIFDPKGR